MVGEEQVASGDRVDCVLVFVCVILSLCLCFRLLLRLRLCLFSLVSDAFTDGEEHRASSDHVD